jgi:hypothetical protein
MLRVLALTFLITAGACSLEHEVSRVPVPGTDLTLVITQDEKRMFSYEVFSGEEAVSDRRLFSEYCSEPLPPAEITQQPGTVKISWQVKCQEGLFIEFDLGRVQLRRDSNLSGAPPTIRSRR